MSGPGVFSLVGLALLFRFSGAAVRTSEIPLSRLFGWSLCAVAAWMAAGAAGAFAPIGLALLAGFILSLVDSREYRVPLWIAGEAVIVALCGLASFPRLTVAAMAVAGVGFAAVGAGIDRLMRRLPGVVRAAAVALPVLVWIAHGVILPTAHGELVRDKWPQLRPATGLFLAAAAADRGERVVLETGAVAWLTRPPGPPPYRGALFFHGSDEDGAYQRGGLFLRRTLVSLGYAVLAVDADGFGDSPIPERLHDVDAWDPLPTSIAAARYVESLPDVRGSIVAVGHSMGATRVLRLLKEWIGSSAGVILGATVMPPPEDNDRFYDFFIDDFDLPPDELSPEFVLDVRTRYSNNDRAAAELREGHAPILFVRFAFDYVNIIAGREELYAMLPGRKRQWELRSDHQFSSSRTGGVLTSDWRIMRDLRRGLGRFLEGRNPASGAPMPFAPR